MKYLLILAAACAVTAKAESTTKWREWERRSQQIETEVLRPMAKAWRARDLAASQAPLTGDAVLCDFALPASPDRTFDGIRQYRRAAPSVPARPEVKKYLESAAAVDDVSLTVLDVNPAGDTAELWLDVRARMADGSRRNDRGRVVAKLRDEGGALRLASLSCPALETLTASKAAFADATKTSGLDAIQPEAREEAIRRGGYALAVSDYDGDGKPDSYVGGRSAGRLMRNAGGRFVDATKDAGLGADTMVKAALFADLDNDGKPDLVLQRFVDDENAELVFYRNAGKGKFVKADAKVTRLQKHDRPMGMGAADFNEDGLLDIYVGYPGVRDFTDPALNDKKAVAHQAVYLNRGAWAFSEAPEAAQPGSAIYGALVRPHSALGFDLNRDGLQDLLVVDDRGAPTRFYVNLGGGKFEERQEKAGLRNAGWGMNAAAGDFAGDGRDAIYFSNVDFSAGRRIVRFVERAGGPDKSIPGFAALKANVQGNRLYRSRTAGISDIAFDDVTEKAGLGWAGEAPAGSAWIDYNADGKPDLYVTNGLWSANPDVSADSKFILDQMALENPNGFEDPNRVMKGLQASGASLGGHQHHRLFHNDGNGSFTEIAYVSGADRSEDGYVAATGDFDGDGRVDLMLRNTDPPSLKYPYAPVTLLLNRGPSDKTLALSLRGRDGTAAFGALVTAYYQGRRESRQLHTVDGAVQSEPVIYLGMGDEKLATVEVRWPSGTIDVLPGLKPGRVTVKENQASGGQRRVARVETTDANEPASVQPLLYGIYTAMDRRDPSACVVARDSRYEIDDDPGIPRSVNGEWLCSSYYHFTAFFKALIDDSKDFDKVCRDYHHFEVPAMTSAQLTQICGIIKANRADPEAACTKQEEAGFFRNPQAHASCVKDYQAYTGGVAECGGPNGSTSIEHFRDRCTGQAYKRAQQGDGAQCAKLDACRALRGEAGALAAKHKVKKVAISAPIDGESRTAGK